MLSRPCIWSAYLSDPCRLFADAAGLGPKYGLGKHIDQVSPHDFENLELVRGLSPSEDAKWPWLINLLSGQLHI